MCYSIISGMNPKASFRCSAPLLRIRRWSIFLFIDHLAHKARGSPNFPQGLRGKFYSWSSSQGKQEREWSGTKCRRGQVPKTISKLLP